MASVRGYVRGGIHMLLILSPIVSAGGLIDDALAPKVFILTQVYTPVKQVLILHQYTLLLIFLPVLLEDSYSFYETQNVIPL